MFGSWSSTMYPTSHVSSYDVSNLTCILVVLHLQMSSRTCMSKIRSCVPRDSGNHVDVSQVMIDHTIIFEIHTSRLTTLVCNEVRCNCSCTEILVFLTMNLELLSPPLSDSPFLSSNSFLCFSNFRLFKTQNRVLSVWPKNSNNGNTRCISLMKKGWNILLLKKVFVRNGFYWEQQIKREIKGIHILRCRCNERSVMGECSVRRTSRGESEWLITLDELLKLQEIGQFLDEPVKIEGTQIHHGDTQTC